MLLRKTFPLFFALLALPFFIDAQVTTSSISGFVKNKNGNGLPGASITATHIPTGTVYTALARNGGSFDINNMNPGGPYTINTTFVGFEADKKDDIFLILGETQTIDIKLSDKTTQLTEVVISTRTSARPVGETQIGRDKLANLPTIGRNLADFVRFTPQAKTTGTGGISIAGQNNRYNGFLIDGSVNNDVFGLSDQATNGGRAGTPPISIDAIDQIVVQTSPYDAALGNFTGGAINAITKSGTNNFHGSLYYIFRNQSLSGKTPGAIPDSLRLKQTKFKNQTYGFTIGGPIIKNKAFFFLNVEKQKDNRPQPFTPTAAANGYSVPDTVAKLVNFVKSTYQYDPGDYNDNPDLIDRLNINSRFDFNLSSKNKLTVSYRYTKAERYNPARSTFNGSSGSINFVNGAEYYPSVTHSGNIELNSKFNNKLNNKFRASFTDVVDDRDITGSPFPRIVINAYNGGPSYNIGSEQASSANILKQRIINFYDAFKVYAGKNAITVGVDVDLNKSYDLFINRNFGLYTYSSITTGVNNGTNALDAFINGFGPSRYQRSYSLVDPGNKGGDANTNSAVDFKSLRLGFFVNDDIKINNNFTVTVGLRADKTSFLTGVPIDSFFRDTAAAIISQYYDLSGAETGKKFTPTWQFSPRIGFRYNIPEENILIHGGVGIFAGRTPLVWPGGIYQNPGTLVGAVDQSAASGSVVTIGSPAGPLPFRADVNNQYTQADFGLAPSLLKPQGDLNLVSKNFKLPEVLKTSLGVDKKLGKGWTIGVEGLFTKNIFEVDWSNVNIIPPTTLMSTWPDARLIYSTNGNPNKIVLRPWSASAAVRNPYSNIILIKNSKGAKGFSYNFTVTLNKRSQKGFAFDASYTYGNSQVHNEATSSVNTSNWQFMETVNGRNFLPLSTSDFDLGHRIFALISKKFTYAKGHLATTVALAYNGQSGNPFSYVYSNRAFVADGVTGNDLMYIPASRAEMDLMTFVQNGALTPTQQKDQFEEFINGDKYLRKHRGRFAERNGARLPFTNILDLNVQQDFSVKTGTVAHTLSVRFDMFNLTNFIDHNAGRQFFLTNDQTAVVSFEGFVAGNTPTYKFFKPTNNKVGTISDSQTSPYNSARWNGQVTIRYSF